MNSTQVAARWDAPFKPLVGAPTSSRLPTCSERVRGGAFPEDRAHQPADAPSSAIAVIAPVAPLLLTMMPMEELVKKLAAVLL